MKKILVVDDETNIVKAVEFILKNSGYSVITACDGQEALEKIQREKPDLIILDLMLPKLDGYKVCHMLESEEEHKDIPVVMLTARGEVSNVKMGLEAAGVIAYITKPFESKVLLGIIKGALGE